MPKKRKHPTATGGASPTTTMPMSGTGAEEAASHEQDCLGMPLVGEQHSSKASTAASPDHGGCARAQSSNAPCSPQVSDTSKDDSSCFEQRTKRERQMKMARNSITVVLGSQWGDEGKGKLVDTLASEVDVVARCQGGNNAGHTVVVDGAHYHFHLIPGGMIHKSCIGVIGNGCVVHPGQIIEEINNLHANGLNLTGRLFISNRAHIVFDFHQQCDGLHEAEKSKRHQKLGTTKKGIGPTYSSKAQRNGMRMCDLIGDWKVFETKFRTLVEFHQRMFTDLQVDVAEDLKRLKLNADRLRPFVCDTVSYIHDAIREGKRIMVEGANAAMLDIDFGTYPYVTSSNCTVGGVCTGIGIPPSFIGTVYGVFKAYCTRVGDGPFPTELTDELGKLLQDRGSERGVTTGRPRRCGWLDIVMLRYSTLVNGYTAFCLTKLDIFDVLDEVKIAHKYRVGDAVLNCPPASLDELAKVQVEYVTLPGWKTSTEECRRFEDLPENAKNYVRTCEGLLGVRVQYIGSAIDHKPVFGPNRVLNKGKLELVFETSVAKVGEVSSFQRLYALIVYHVIEFLKGKA